MSWTFHQASRQVIDPSNMLRGYAYAGRGKGLNNPLMEDIHGGCRWDEEKNLWAPVEGLTADDWGPLCCGLYEMQEPVDTKTHGPFVIWLTPDSENKMFGRAGFGWHGDSKEHPGLASEGCMCSLRALRQLAWDGGDHQLQVFP